MLGLGVRALVALGQDARGDPAVTKGGVLPVVGMAVVGGGQTGERARAVHRQPFGEASALHVAEKVSQRVLASPRLDRVHHLAREDVVHQLIVALDNAEREGVVGRLDLGGRQPRCAESPRAVRRVREALHPERAHLLLGNFSDIHALILPATLY